jgi:phage terminase Nu1 subunit (DNA packaging protein)
MRTPKTGFDIDRYRQLLAHADNDVSRRALIDLLIEENARDRLAADEAQRQAMRQSEAIRRLIHHPSH